MIFTPLPSLPTMMSFRRNSIFAPMESTDWFKTWFDTPFYHALYKNRDDQEAKLFVEKLIHFLAVPKDSYILDMACGKGRHSLMLHEMGMRVLGIDLSPNSIQAAKSNENPRLKFEVHDMRKVIPSKKFDCIFNLFTSFGYFDENTDNEKVLQSVHQMLSNQGIFVIDFMNSVKTIENLVPEEIKTTDSINFRIKRRYDGSHIFKNIQFEHQNQSYDFTERVQALKLNDFQLLLKANNFQIIHTFGDFNLNPFDPLTSDRLILIATKK
jgi:SAM-dependent methyltransferase